MSESRFPNQPALIRAMQNEDEFTALCVGVRGPGAGPAQAQRLMARTEKAHREDIRIMRLMMPDVMRVFRAELRGLGA